MVFAKFWTALRSPISAFVAFNSSANGVMKVLVMLDAEALNTPSLVELRRLFLTFSSSLSCLIFSFMTTGLISITLGRTIFFAVFAVLFAGFFFFFTIKFYYITI